MVSCDIMLHAFSLGFPYRCEQGYMWVDTLGKKKLLLYTSWFPDLAWFGRERKRGRPGSIHHVNGHMDIRWILRGSGILSTYEPSKMQPLDTEWDSQNTWATPFVLNFHISNFVSPPHCIHLKSVRSH